MPGASGFDERHRTGAREGAPPPTPPRSFLAERGEFDRAPDVVSRQRRSTACAVYPLSRLRERVRLSGRG
jgi:hypothetical protein